MINLSIETSMHHLIKLIETFFVIMPFIQRTPRDNRGFTVCKEPAYSIHQYSQRTVVLNLTHLNKVMGDDMISMVHDG